MNIIDTRRSLLIRLPRWLRRMSFLFLVRPGSVASAQDTKSTTSAKPSAFEVADVHPSCSTFRGRYFRIAPLSGNHFMVQQATPLAAPPKLKQADSGIFVAGPAGRERRRPFERSSRGATLGAGRIAQAAWPGAVATRTAQCPRWSSTTWRKSQRRTDSVHLDARSEIIFAALDQPQRIHVSLPA